VPNIQLGLTSQGRLLVSREYSEMGKRGNFKQHIALGQGTRAVTGNVAYPGADLGKPPSNPFNPAVGLEFVQLRSPGGEVYEAWMSPQGAQVGRQGFCSVLQALGSA
jgi:hypothetical protein